MSELKPSPVLDVEDFGMTHYKRDSNTFYLEYAIYQNKLSSWCWYSEFEGLPLLDIPDE